MNARRIAFDVLTRVNDGAYADLSLDQALRRLSRIDPRDRGLATELVYGVLRQQNRLDYVLAERTRQTLNELEPPVLLLLRIGAYQILALDRIPAAVAVHETVTLAKQVGLQRAAGLTNAVLRRLIREIGNLVWPSYEQDPVGHLTWALSLPAWLAELWHRDLGDESVALAKSLLKPARLSLRVNTLKIDRDAYLQQLLETGHQGQKTLFAPEGLVITDRGNAPLPGDQQGFYQVQDEASMMIAHLVDPKPDEILLDCCAAPGGKTTHLAALTGNRAKITALDLHPHRLRLVEQGAQRLGCKNIVTKVWDMTQPPGFLSAKSFDAILVDAPCSGLGVLRRNPEIRWRLQPGDLSDLQQRQLAILDQASRLVGKGGRLVYSVCTFSREETTLVVEQFLQHHPDFILQPLATIVPQTWHPLIDRLGALRTLPHCHGLDGFFAVRFERFAL